MIYTVKKISFTLGEYNNKNGQAGSSVVMIFK